MSKVTYIISEVNKAVFFENTALLLRKNGYDVSFILINSVGGAFDFFLQENNFDIYYLEVGRVFFSLKQILKCKSILKKIDPIIIHCHLGAANWVGLWAGYSAGIKNRIYTRHSGKPLRLSFKEKIIDYIQNKLATNIVAISKNISNILQSQNVPLSKISLIHHGFDTGRMVTSDKDEVLRIKQIYNPLKKSPVIGVVARWLELKGIQYIIPAFEKLLVEYPEAKLCLFNASNNADYSLEIKNLLSKMPGENYECIAFENNVYDLYQLFDIYIHVPINPTCEAFGQTYIEALAAGIPSVFTLSGVASEFIKDKENAIVVDFKNSEQIYNGLKILLTHVTIKENIIRQGRKDVQKLFGLDTYISNLLKLYRNQK